jgi:hypothetical protein
VKRALLPLAFFLLTGMSCDVPHAVCPPLKEYPESFSNRLANEMEALPADSATVEAIGDYIALRDSVRACQ